MTHPIFISKSENDKTQDSCDKFPQNALGKARQQKLNQYAKRIGNSRNNFMDLDLKE